MMKIISKKFGIKNKSLHPTSGHTPWGFQRNLQVQFSLARFVTGDRFVFTDSPTSHTADRWVQAKKNLPLMLLSHNKCL
jgi:hypothetical protein